MDAGQYLWYNLSSPAEVGLPTAVKGILRMRYDTDRSVVGRRAGRPPAGLV